MCEVCMESTICDELREQKINENRLASRCSGAIGTASSIINPETQNINDYEWYYIAHL